MRITDLMGRAKDALGAGREDLAQGAAQAIAAMENELTVRRGTVQRPDRSPGTSAFGGRLHLS